MFLFIWLAFGIVTALAASARGRSFFAWLVIGCLTGIFGLIAVLVMENLKTSSKA
jgi:predicted outer membrane lipoprotein